MEEQGKMQHLVETFAYWLMKVVEGLFQSITAFSAVDWMLMVLAAVTFVASTLALFSFIDFQKNKKRTKKL